MKTKIRIIDGDRVAITKEKCDLEDDLPKDLDFSTLKEVEHPLKSMIMLDSEVSAVFKTSEQVNLALKAIIKAIPKTVASM